MKKILRFFTALFVVSLFTVFSVQAQDKEVDIDGNYKGVIRIKIDKTLESAFKAKFVSKSGVYTQKIVKDSKSSFLRIGIPALDKKNEKFSAISYKRVFRYAGKFEERHKQFGLHLWYEIEFANQASSEQFIDEYKQVKGITLVEAVPHMMLIGSNVSSLTGEPNDNNYSAQWNFNNTGQTGGTVDADIDLPEAWVIETGSSDVIVAIQDGGVDYSHVDLDGNMWHNAGEIAGNGIDDDNNGYVDDYYGYNFGDEKGEIEPGEHGTHVGGIVAAETNNGTGVSGVAGGTGNNDGVRLMSVQIFGESSQGGFDEGFIYAADMGAHISQNSWGGGDSQSIYDAVDYFIAYGGSVGSPMQGGVVIFAANNYNTSTGPSTWPSQYVNAIAVASTDHNDVKSSFSNYGPWVDISAPGSNIYSCKPGNQYQYMSGTSMACPHVSGVAALIISNQAGNITPAEVKNRLLSSVDDISVNNSGYIGQLGSGRLNAYAAVKADISGSSNVCSSNNQTYTLHNRPTGVSVTWSRSSNLNYVSGQGTDNYTVVGDGSNGSGWVKATINGIEYIKSFWVGPFALMQGPNYVPYLGSGTWNANSNCSNSYEWFLKKEGWTGYVSIQNSSSHQLILNSVSASRRIKPLPYEETTYQLFVRARNNNGNYYQTDSKFITAEGIVDLVVAGSRVLPPFDLQISPNPVSSILTVDIENNNSSIDTEYSIKLVDKYQKTVYQQNTKNSQITINVSGLQLGVYFLQVINGQDMLIEKIIVVD